MFTHIVYSQKIQNAIWGCKFGASKKEVVSVIKKQELKYIDEGLQLKIESPKFGGVTFDYAYFHFYLDKMYEGFFCLYFNDEKSAFSIYSYLKDNLAKKYGYKKETNKEGAKTILYDNGVNGIMLSFSKGNFRPKLSSGISDFSYHVDLTYVDWTILKEVTDEI